ncbi:hypothetical protein ACF3MZ_01670 [Paenibacillaceae bacterium WGS1546]|uniref:hypothetical protein n=1 Tax=Cohnella sp. WGS1546 TaxID=3366810 RepID=UPI00372CF8FE
MGKRLRFLVKTLGAGALGLSLMGADAGAGGGAAPIGKDGRLLRWNDVVTAVHAWPKLIEDGKVD